MSLAKTTSIFNNLRIGMALLLHVKPLPVPVQYYYPSTITTTTTYNYAGLIIGIRAYSSSVSGHPKEDPNLVDNMREGVFRFQTSEQGETDEASRNGRDNDYQAKDEVTDDATATTTSMADMAKQGTVKTMETGLSMGDKAKETMDNVWDAARETTHKINEAVAGDDEKEKRGYDIPPIDANVEDLRNKAGGYDLKDRGRPPSMASEKIGNSVKE